MQPIQQEAKKKKKDIDRFHNEPNVVVTCCWLPSGYRRWIIWGFFGWAAGCMLQPADITYTGLWLASPGTRGSVCDTGILPPHHGAICFCLRKLGSTWYLRGSFCKFTDASLVLLPEGYASRYSMSQAALTSDLRGMSHHWTQLEHVAFCFRF